MDDPKSHGLHGDTVSGHIESMAGGRLVRIAVALLLETATAMDNEAGDLVANWEGSDTGHGSSDAIRARADALRALAVEVSRLVPPPPASPAVTHQQPEQQE